MASKKSINSLKRKSEVEKKNSDLPPPALKKHELYDLVNTSKVSCCARGKKFGCILEGLARLKSKGNDDALIINHDDAVNLFAECRNEVLLKSNDEKEQFVKDKVKGAIDNLNDVLGKIHSEKLTTDDAFDICIALPENQTTSNEYYSSSSLKENFDKRDIPEDAIQNKTFKFTYSVCNKTTDFKDIILCRKNFSLLYDITQYDIKKTASSIKSTKHGDPYRVNIPTYNDKSYHDFTWNETEEIFKANLPDCNGKYRRN